jgi:hypothetical protein
MKALLLLISMLIGMDGFTQVASRLDKLDVNDLTAKKLNVVSTVAASKPCPAMTQEQRDAIVSPLEGQCVYNSTVKTLNLFDGNAWVQVAGGGDGGISNWEASKFYEVGSVVIQDAKIYQANTQHTSTTFQDDFTKWNLISGVVLDEATGTLSAEKIADGSVDDSEFEALDGVTSSIQDQIDSKENTITSGTTSQYFRGDKTFQELDKNAVGLGSVDNTSDLDKPISTATQTALNNKEDAFSVLSLSKGGTNKALTATSGSVVYSDNDSLELTAQGNEGQFLKSNGSSAPSWEDIVVSLTGKAQNEGPVTLEEIQVPGNQLTETGAGKHLVETGNNNILANPSFEHSVGSNSWTNAGCVFSSETLNAFQGLKNANLDCTNQTLNLFQDSTLYASQLSNVQGLASIRVKTNTLGVQVCARKDGAYTTDCVDVVNDNTWKLIKIPFVLGGISNGIGVKTNANVTGLTLIDDAFVGAVDATETVPLITEWKSYTPTFQGLTPGASTNLRWRQVGNNIEIEGVIVSSSSTATEMRMTLPQGFVAASNISESSGLVKVGHGTISSTGGNTRVLLIGNSFAYLNFSLENNATFTPILAQNASIISAAGTRLSIFATIRVDNLSSSINTYTSQCQSDIECTEVFVARVNGSVSPSVVSDENVDWLNGNCSRTSTGIYQCPVNPGVFSQKPICEVQRLAATSASNPCLVTNTTSSTSINVHCRAIDTGALYNADEFTISCQRSTDFKPRRQIVGSFKQVEELASVVESVAYIKDVKPSGTGPGSFGSTYATRALNTLSDPLGIVASLSSNQFTLGPGIYHIEAHVPSEQNGAGSNPVKARLFNVTTNSVELISDNTRVRDISSAPINTGMNIIVGVVSVESNTTFRVEQRSNATVNGGTIAAFGDVEVYTQVKIRKLK